jgi:predicted DNA-binding transcriptional regulator AlpA
MSPAALKLHPTRNTDLDAERLIDRGAFQALLGVSQSCFERWLAMGRLPEPIRFSRTCHRWKLAAVLDWIERGCPDARGNRKSR